MKWLSQDSGEREGSKDIRLRGVERNAEVEEQ